MQAVLLLVCYPNRPLPSQQEEEMNPMKTLLLRCVSRRIRRVEPPATPTHQTEDSADASKVVRNCIDVFAKMPDGLQGSIVGVLVLLSRE